MFVEQNKGVCVCGVSWFVWGFCLVVFVLFLFVWGCFGRLVVSLFVFLVVSVCLLFFALGFS